MGKSKKLNRYDDNSIIQINKKKCVSCTACAFTCAQETKLSILKESSNEKKIIMTKKANFEDSGCVYCGQCILKCPIDAISGRNDMQLVKDALSSGKYLILTAAPAVKVSLGEMFNLPIGSDVSGKIAPSAKKLGFNNVFDTNFANDMSVIEISNELIKRITNYEKLPVFTSACPSFIRYAEIFYPEILENISTIKSPQQIMGTAIKTYFADMYNILPTNIITVSIESCISKKYEAEIYNDKKRMCKDIDIALTVNEYAELLKESGIDITAIPDEKTDSFMGEYTGSAVLFGVTGGILKAVFRVIMGSLNKDVYELDNVKFKNVDNYKYVKESSITIEGDNYKVAVVNGLKEIDKFIASEKWKEYCFIEVMACEGGCINGGGTPKIEKKAEINKNLCISCKTCIQNCPVNSIRLNDDQQAQIQMEKCIGCELCSNICRAKAIDILYYDKSKKSILKKDFKILRKEALENIDAISIERVSTGNNSLLNMYKSYIGEPNGTKANELFHIDYLKNYNNRKHK